MRHHGQGFEPTFCPVTKKPPGERFLKSNLIIARDQTCVFSTTVMVNIRLSLKILLSLKSTDYFLTV